MKEQLAALYELQTLDVKIAQANARLAALNGAKNVKSKLAAAKPALEAAEKTLTDYEIELKDSELKLKSIDEKRASLEKRLYSGSITNPKELGAIEKEIKMLKEKQRDLDGRTLELYEMVEESRNKAQAARKGASDLENELSAALTLESTEKSEIDAHVATLTSERDAAAAKVTDKPLLSRYEVVKKRTGNTGIAKVKSGRCEGCNVSITSFTARKLFEAKEHVSCENCGRLLYQDYSE